MDKIKPKSVFTNCIFIILSGIEIQILYEYIQ